MIRDVKPNDLDQWEALWECYNTFYKRTVPPQMTRLTWSRFFDGYEPIHALVAEKDGQLVGLVHYLFHRSTTMIGPNCYLQDLFTAEGERGKGIGHALIESVYGRAKAAGCSEVYWQTHETNQAAMKLYDKVAERSGFVVYSKKL